MSLNKVDKDIMMLNKAANANSNVRKLTNILNALVTAIKQGIDPNYTTYVNEVVTEAIETEHLTTQNAISQQNKEIDDFKEAVTDQVNSYQPIVIEGDVTNAADEEDITSENGLLKFKNRSALNGMGYVILRRDSSFASQVVLPNTIYEVRYNFDLGGGSVTIPSGCTLQFIGGKLTNGTLVGNVTKVSSVSRDIFNVSINGTWDVPIIYAEWFTDNLQSAINMSDNSVLFLEKRTYVASQKLTCPTSVTIEGCGAIIKRNFQDDQLLTAANVGKITLKNLELDGNNNNKAVVYLSRVNNVIVSGCVIKNAGSVSIVGNHDGLYCLNCDLVEIKRTRFSNCSRDGIYSVSTVNLVVEDCEIEDVRAYGVANDGSNMYARKYIYSTKYIGNRLKKCGSGGLHCESVSVDTTRENSPTDDTRTEYLVENNIIEDCGNSALGTSYGAITAGQYTNTLISNNIIRRWRPQREGVYIANPAIGYAKLFNLSIINNQFDDIQGDIIYVDGSVGITTSFEFSNNLCNVSKTAVSCYMMSTADITNNIFNISEANGVAIKLNLSNNILIKDNIFNSSLSGCTSVLITQNSTVLVDKNVYNTENRIVSDTETYVINRSGLYNQIGANRPTLSLIDAGFQYFDTDLGKPIYWQGTKWVDSTGADIPS